MKKANGNYKYVTSRSGSESGRLAQTMRLHAWECMSDTAKMD